MRPHRLGLSPRAGLRPALAGLALIAATSPQAQQTGPGNVPCEGVGRLISTAVTVQAQGRSMVVGQGTNDAVDVSVESCGRNMVIDAPQARIALQRATLKETTLEGTVVTDMPAEWRLSMVNPRLLEGKAVATMPNGGTASARITLKLTEARAPDLDGCSADVSEPVSPKDAGHAALAAILLEGDRRLPAGYAIGDYVSRTRAGPRADRVHVVLSSTNEIVPLHADSVSLAEICNGTGWLEPPRWLLNYKITHATDATYVFVQKIEMETGVIAAQREGVADGRGSEALRAAMHDATAKLSAPPQDFSAGAD